MRIKLQIFLQPTETASLRWKTPRGSSQTFDPKHLMPDTVLVRKKAIVSQADQHHLLPVATEQESSNEQGRHSTGTRLCWLVPGDLIHECRSSWTKQQEARHMVKLSRECNSHETLPSATNNTATLMPQLWHLYFISLQKWCLAAELGFKKKGEVSFQFNFSSTCRAHSSSSDFFIYSVEVYPWVSHLRLPLGSMKSYRYF